MFSLEFSYHFEAAHRFTKGSSKCSTPHGHTWEATLVFTSLDTTLDSGQMVAEFEILKRNWRNFLTNTVDHSFLHHADDPLLPAFRDHVSDFRGLPFPGDPTTELIAALFLTKAQAMNLCPQVLVSAVVIQETKTNRIRCDQETAARVMEQIRKEYPELSGWWDEEDPASRSFG